MATLEIHSPSKKTIANPFAIYLLWILATTAGWLVGVVDLNSAAKTYMDIVRLLPIYLVDGLLIGLVAGIGQALVLRRFTNLSWDWAWATVLGCGLAFLAGLIVSVSIPSIIWRLKGESFLPLLKPSTISIFMNRDDLFWGGYFIGLIQWRVLKRIIPNPNRNKAVLWVLANWFVLGLSIFVGAFTHETILANFQMGIMGLVMGIITGILLLAFLSTSHSTEREVIS